MKSKSQSNPVGTKSPIMPNQYLPVCVYLLGLNGGCPSVRLHVKFNGGLVELFRVSAIASFNTRIMGQDYVLGTALSHVRVCAILKLLMRMRVTR